MSPNTIKIMQPVSVTVYAGVDVAKASLQLHLQGRQTEFPNQPAGLAQLRQQLQKIPHVHVSCKKHALLMANFRSHIMAVEKQIEALIAKDAVLQQRMNCLEQIQGVGPRTAGLVLAHMPELGQLNRQGVAALAGLAPWTRES